MNNQHQSNWAYLMRYITYSMVLTAVIPLFSISIHAAVQEATSNTALVRHIRTVEIAEASILNPVGLTFSSAAKAFYVIGEPLQDENSPAKVDIIRMTPFSDLVDIAQIAVSIQEPVNFVFDQHFNRILIFLSSIGRLVEVKQMLDGSLDSTQLGSRKK